MVLIATHRSAQMCQKAAMFEHLLSLGHACA